MDMLRLFDPSDPRMAGKRYLTDDDPQLQKSREAYLTWKALASPKDGDLIPDEARALVHHPNPSGARRRGSHDGRVVGTRVPRLEADPQQRG